MTLAYPVNRVTVKKVVGFESADLTVGTIWQTGNLLFLAAETGADRLHHLNGWARAEDAQGRVYILWKAGHHQTENLVIQRLDSYYCFEVARISP